MSSFFVEFSIGLVFVSTIHKKINLYEQIINLRTTSNDGKNPF